jgi:pyrimidine deaminase RibD-like protein
MKISDFRITNHDKLDDILVRLCEMVIEGQQKDPEKYGMVASCVLDPDNNAVAALNYKVGDKSVHGERAAIDAYEHRFGDIPDGSIILTTCSPCSDPMPERVGESCQDLISSTNVHKVYAGYRNPSQHTQYSDKTYHLQITRNKKIQALCQAFADTWLSDDLDEGTADHVRMVMTLAADLMKQHGFRAVTQLSAEDLEQIAQQTDATLHDVCIILNIDHVDQQLDELSFMGSQCTKDCSGHRAGYAWSKSRGGRDANSPFSPSFNKGSAIGTAEIMKAKRPATPKPPPTPQAPTL